MASICDDPKGFRRILFVDKAGKRKCIRLGKMPKRLADETKTKVESLNAAAISGHSIDGESAEWRLIFALARFGGLRCPSEFVPLKWEHVDWARNRFWVTSPKTERHQGHEGRW